MADAPSEKSKKPVDTEKNPKPEILKPRTHDASAETAASDTHEKPKAASKLRKTSLRSRYHLSHKATFLGLGVVVIILAVNAIIIALVIGNQAEEDEARSNQVTVSQEALEGLGVNRTTSRDSGVELIVGPNAIFEREVQIAGGLSVGGELILNERLSAVDASMGSLQAGDTTLEQLNVSGDGTLTNINVREDLAVVGTTRLQGPVTISQLLTVENSINVAGNLTVGGALSVNTFQASNLTVSGTVRLGGHIITSGSAPSVSVGAAAGSNGTASISGSDTAGTVGFNAGVGAGNGIVAHITFSSSYGNIPRVVITPIGNVGSFYVFRTREGFSIGVGNSVSPGGYAFDYIVMQ